MKGLSLGLAKESPTPVKSVSAAFLIHSASALLVARYMYIVAVALYASFYFTDTLYIFTVI